MYTTFNTTTRIGDSMDDLSQQNIQDTAAANYRLMNYKPQCPMTNAIDFATSQPAINFTGSHTVGIGGCNIDENSNLTLSDLSRNKCKISLLQRPFLTVPYLGRGVNDAMTESQLQQGELANNRKSVNPSSELTHSNYTPLIPSLQATINNPANLIEGVAADGWIRGGIPVRQLARDQSNHT